MSKKVTTKTKINSSTILNRYKKYVYLGIAIVAITVFFYNIIAKPTDINLVGSRLGSGTKSTGGGATSTVTTTTQKNDSKTTVVETKPVPKNNSNGGDDAFAGMQLGGGTKSDTGKDNNTIINSDDKQQGGRCTGSECVVSTVTNAQGGLSPDKQTPELKNNSGSPDDRQDKTDAQRSTFDGAIGGGYKGTDSNGSEILFNTKSENLDNGNVFVTSVHTTTSTNGNQVVKTVKEEKDRAGNIINTNSVLVTRTRNSDGTYAIVSENDKGDTRYFNAQTNTSASLSPESNPVLLKTNGSLSGDNTNKDELIDCGTKTKVKTSRGTYCASASATNCDNVGFRLNDRCYWIGEEVSPGNKVCDWTIGGRKGVNYPFLSTNCPTKSASQSQVAKNVDECSSGDNAGWWNDAEKKCYRPGDHVALDSTHTVQVCKGGRLSKDSSCPEDVSLNNSAGNLGYDKNSGQYTYQNPAINTDGLSADKQSGQFNEPRYCNFSISCQKDTEKCSNNGKFFQKGICVAINPTLSPDKQSAENGGMGKFVQDQNGKTNEVTSDSTECKYAGAQLNKVGKYVCPSEDGSIDPALDAVLCTFNPMKLSGYQCLLEKLLSATKSDSNKGNDDLTSKDSSGEGLNINSNAGVDNADSIGAGSSPDMLEGKECKDGTGIWHNGTCVINAKR